MNGNGNSVPLTAALQSLEQAIETAPAAEAPLILGTLERLKAVVWKRLFTERQPEQQETTGKPTLLTAQDVAKRLNVPKSFVYEAARQGKLKPVKLGEKYVRFTQGTVDEYLAKSGS